jgi:hypothetical protein
MPAEVGVAVDVFRCCFGAPVVPAVALDGDHHVREREVDAVPTDSVFL